MADRNTGAQAKSLEDDMEALRRDLKSLASTVGDLGKAKSEDVKEQVGATVDKAVERGREAADTVQEAVRQRPVASVLTAFGVGLLIGHLLDRR